MPNTDNSGSSRAARVRRIAASQGPTPAVRPNIGSMALDADLGKAECCPASSSVITLEFPSSTSPYTVLKGYTSVKAYVWGEDGDDGTNMGGEGGVGAYLTGDFAVTEGDVLTVSYNSGGGIASAGVGYFAGGNGGGLSSVTLNSNPIKLFVAGGGGGGGAGGGSGGPKGGKAWEIGNTIFNGVYYGSAGEYGFGNGGGGGGGISGGAPGGQGATPGGGYIGGQSAASDPNTQYGGGGGGAGNRGGGGGQSDVSDNGGGGGGSSFVSTSVTNSTIALKAATIGKSGGVKLIIS